MSAANHCNKMEFERDSECSSIQKLMPMLFMEPPCAKLYAIWQFLGAAAGSPYIVFITRFRRMASGHGYIQCKLQFTMVM